MNSLLEQWWYRLKHKCKYRLRQLKCLLTEHDVIWSNYTNSYYCRRCDARNPLDSFTLFLLLNRCYCRLVSAEWDWFDKLDMWLCEKYCMPSWWEY